MRIFTWAGTAIILIALLHEFYVEWLSPRLLSAPQIPREPDLPPIGGGDDSTKNARRFNVYVAAYTTGGILLIIGGLDAAPFEPACLPYTDFLNTYISGALAFTTAIIAYTNSGDGSLRYASEVQYVIASVTVILQLYIRACGAGVL